LTLLEAARDHGIRHFIFSSTCATYGTPECVPIPEDCPQAPINPYGASKLMIERMLADFGYAHGLRYVALRYFNAAGADPEGEIGEDHDPETHLIPIVLQVALGQREHVTIFGDDYETPDGTCVRDYIHIVDLAQAHILALQALDRGSRVYNLGNGQGFSVKQVIDTAREITGHPIPARVGPRRPGDPAVLVAGSQRIRDELGWQPQFPHLRDIVATAWRWHSRHPQGYTG